MSRQIPLPRSWNRRTKAAILQIVALSHYTFATILARAANDRDRRTRVQAEIDRLNHELALLREGLRIKDARMGRVPPHRQPGRPSAWQFGAAPGPSYILTPS